MQTTEIPTAITTAATAMLQPYAPGLTSAGLVAAITYRPDEEKIERLLTRKDTASRLSISVVTLDRMIRRAGAAGDERYT
ncbi:hypothetical protein [Pontiella sulfatireligans]|uniref:Uncharacterized protein n=1 Tax=Pontiella sulfatireligans TaxID=2750658 RepID=A0A6C2UFX8_9BACT|nr:hypothetical protein [Pontiella sulfatireligans]VGO19018.1 hypothetical protein SCARR_01072 [Pontiella sulfatireligans]